MDRKAFVTGYGSIAYWVDATAGQDEHWLVFPPRLTTDHTLFDAQMRYFSGRAKCLVWDAPAHGQSRPFPLDFTMKDYVRWLHGILESEGVERPVLVGQSLGGYVSQAYVDLFVASMSDYG